MAGKLVDPRPGPGARRYRAFGALAVVAAVVGTSLVGAPSGGAATASTPYVPTRIDAVDSPPQRWGERLVAAALPGPLGGASVTNGDLDGDGTNDFWTADPFSTPSRVYAVSGRTMKVLYRLQNPTPVGASTFAFGFYISSPGDVTGDGVADLVSGTDAQNVSVRVDATHPGCVSPAAAEPNGCNEGQGKAWVYNGATGALLYALDNPDPQGLTGNSARFGSRLGRAGDINADGFPDIIAGASNTDVCATQTCTDAVTAAQATPGTQASAGDLACADVVPIPSGCRQNQGRAYIFSGANGALLRRLDLPASDLYPSLEAATNQPFPDNGCRSNCGTVGLAVQGPGDLDGDAVTDQLVDAASYGFYTGSGTACGQPEPNGCNENQGRMYLFSGATGALLARIDNPVPQTNATFGFQDASPMAPGDVNNDGRPDLYANGFQQNGPTGTLTQGRAWVFDGASTVATGVGQVLFSVDDPSPELGGQFGWSMTTTNFDGGPGSDIYVGQSPHHEPGATGSGGSYIFDGASSSAAGSAQLLKALELPDADRQASVPGNLGPNLGWGLAAPGDLDGDGEPDYLAGAPFRDVAGVTNAGQIFAFRSRRRPPVPTFDGNTHADLATFRPSAGSWHSLDRATGATDTALYGLSGDVPVPADYDGDGRSDRAVFRPSSGLWAVRRSSDGTDALITYGVGSDVPVPGDYDGDGRSDVAVFRPSLATWFVRGSTTNTDTVVTFGLGGDVPVVADHDGDGRTDMAVYRPATSTWYVLPSLGGPATARSYGAGGDVPVPGDYDGDGLIDVGIYRPSSGLWSIRRSSTETDMMITYGVSSDEAQPDDYDGDGRTDVAVYRPSLSTWFMRDTSTNADTAITFGLGSDVALSLPHAIRRIYYP